MECMETLTETLDGKPGESARQRRLGEGLEEGRSGLAEAAPERPPADPEVVAVAKRRRFSREYKLRIVEEADRRKRPGEVGMLLRREGLHSSHLVAWRRLRQKAARKAGETRRGRKRAPVNPLAAENARLARENARLQLRLRKVEALIELQKKASEILGIELPHRDERL